MNESVVSHYSVVKIVEADKIGSATSPLNLAKTVAVTNTVSVPRAGDVIVVRSLTDSPMGQDYIEREFSVPAANARRDGTLLFERIISKLEAARLSVIA